MSQRYEPSRSRSQPRRTIRGNDDRRTDRDEAVDSDSSLAGRDRTGRPDSLDGFRAELYVRANAPAPVRVRSVIDRIDDLAADGHLDDYALHTVPPEVDLADRSASEGSSDIQGLLDVVDELTGREDCQRYPFRVISRRSAITGETAEVLMLPVLCLLLYDGSKLVDIAPHHGSDRTWSVEDGLSLVAESARAQGSPSAPPAAVVKARLASRSSDRLKVTDRVSGGGE